MNREIEFAGNRYSIGRLDAMRQFHVARRVAPVLTRLASAGGLSALMGAVGGDDEALAAKLIPIMEEASTVVSEMKDSEVEYVIFTCLSVVTRFSGTGWAPVSRGNQLMFADIDMSAMMRLTVETIKENMGDFFGARTDGSASPN